MKIYLSHNKLYTNTKIQKSMKFLFAFLVIYWIFTIARSSGRGCASVEVANSARHAVHAANRVFRRTRRLCFSDLLLRLRTRGFLLLSLDAKVPNVIVTCYNVVVVLCTLVSLICIFKKFDWFLIFK